MPYKNFDIQNILPQNEVHWKLIFCPKRRISYNEYCISIELKNKKRQYTCVSFEHLFELINKIPIEKRCFYEHIGRGDTVKFYLDYEYYKGYENTRIDVNKALLSIQKLFISVIQTLSNNENISIHDMLVLESSSYEKESYHIILDNMNIRFTNNRSLHLFIKEVFRIVLLVIIDHECLRNKNYIEKKLNNESTLLEAINAFHFVWLEWFNCINCKIKNMEFSVSDICNLFVDDRNGSIVPCIDFKVYGTEQDFRMFMCTKRGEERPLRKNILLEKQSEIGTILVSNIDEQLGIESIKETLQRSLITEPGKNNCYYVESSEFWKWVQLIGFNLKKKTREYDEDEQIIKKKHIDHNEHKILAKTEQEVRAEVWTKSYLKSIKSSGVIHSINTGKHVNFIMCNIRNMNMCKELHEDYFNDSTIYINLREKQFSVRCNRIPCNKKAWIWQLMM